MKTSLASVLALTAAACSYVPNISPHRIEIQQGNFVSQEMIARLKPGMTKDQVRFVLGTPLIADLFHADRWDYVYSRQRANSRDVEERRVVVFFEDGKLTRLEGDVQSSEPRAAATGAKR